MHRNNVTPLGAIVRGLAAGAVGTAAMTGWQELSSKLQSSGEEDGQGSEQQGEQDPWEQASAPAKVARRVSEGVFQQEVPADAIPALTQGMHWGYGTGWGAVYGIVQNSIHARPLRHGLFFGTLVWASSYAQLVPMGLYQPPWKYPPKQLAMDLSYHLVYGVGVAGAHRVLAGR